MRRLTVVLVAVAALAMVANLAIAGDYHIGRLLICSDCHIAHGSQKHGYFTDADTTWLGPHTSDPPYAYLLRGETVANACLNCHDGSGATIPDVLGTTAAGSGLIPNGRSAGALNVPNAGAHGYANDGAYTQTMGHTLWSSDPPPGVAAGAPTIGADGLECSDCHRVHGNKYFRNLVGDVATSTSTIVPTAFKGKEITYVVTAANIPSPNTGTSGVWVMEKGAHGTATHYDNDNVQYLEPDQTRSMYGEWCGACHGNFHGTLTDSWMTKDGHPARHPTANVDMASTSSWKNATVTKRLKVMNNSATWATTGTPPADMTPSCFSCHKSHGNLNRFGLIFVMPQGDASSPTAAVGGSIDPRLVAPTLSAGMTEQGDGAQYRDMCRNCHGMGSWRTGNPTNLQQ